MANKNSPIGGRITGAIHSANFNVRITKYVIPATDSQEYFKNDFVVTNETSEEGLPVVVKATAAQLLRGLIVEFKPEQADDSTLYRVPYTRREVLVCDDPKVEFEMQVSGTIADTDIGKNGDLLVAAGDPAVGISETQIDQTTISTDPRQIKILARIDKPENDLGEYTKVRAMIFEHELNVSTGGGTSRHDLLTNLAYNVAGHGTGYPGFQRGTTNDTVDPTNTDDSTLGYVDGDLWINTSTQSFFGCVDNTATAAVWDKFEHSISDIWNRSGTDIIPANAGDDLVMGTGDVSATNGAFTGKLTVTGLIDPTGLSLDPQGSAPATADGTIYYNLSSNEFEFRENGVWRTLNATGLWKRTGTNLQPTNAGDTIEVDGVGGIQVDATGQNITLFDTDVTLAADSDSRFSTQKAIKAYVDGHPGNDVWQRIGTEISVINAGDTVNFGTAGFVKSVIFDSGTIIKYNTHKTFTLDEEVVDKKYVDDKAGSVVAKQEFLPVTTPGQTAFTLAQTPSGADSFGIFLNGLQQPPYLYSFVGTALTWGGTPPLQVTDLFLAWYDWQAPSIGSLDQFRIYYISKTGSDSNNGLSIEKPFLNINKAITIINPQTPSFTKIFRIELIGGGIYYESNTLSGHTILTGEGAEIVGDTVLGSFSAIKVKGYTGKISFSSGQGWIDVIETLAHATDAIIRQTGGILHVKAKRLDSGASPNKGIHMTGGSACYLEADWYNTNTLSDSIYVGSGANLYFKLKELSKGSGPGAAIHIEGGTCYCDLQNLADTASRGILVDGGTFRGNIKRLSSGNIAYDIKNSAIVHLKTETIGGTQTDDGTNTAYITSLNNSSAQTPATFIAYPNTTLSDATGDGTDFDLVFTLEDIDIGSNYDHTTGVFTVPFDGVYNFDVTLMSKHYDDNHDVYVLQIVTTPATWILEQWNPGILRTETFNYIVISTSRRLKLSKGHTVKFQLTVSGGAKNIDIEPASLISGKLEQRL